MIDPNKNALSASEKVVSVCLLARTVDFFPHRSTHIFAAESALPSVIQEIAPKHSWIEISTTGNVYSIEFLAPTEENQKGKVQLSKYPCRLYRGRPGQLKAEITSRRGSTKTELAARVLGEAIFLRDHPEYLPVYDEMGPNSNGFARFLIESAGGEVDFPWNAYYSKVTNPYRQAFPEYHDVFLARLPDAPEWR